MIILSNLLCLFNHGKRPLIRPAWCLLIRIDDAAAAVVNKAGSRKILADSRRTSRVTTARLGFLINCRRTIQLQPLVPLERVLLLSGHVFVVLRFIVLTGVLSLLYIVLC